MASGANNTFRQVGIATGIAGLGAVFQSQITSKVTAGLSATQAGRAAVSAHGSALRTAFTSGQVRTTAAHFPTAQYHAVLFAYRTAFSSSFNHLMLIAAAVCFLGSVAGYALVRERDFVPSYAPAPTRAEAGTEAGTEAEVPAGAGAPVAPDPAGAT
jgi:hypothetical protein